MTPENFCYWLRGHVEMDKGVTITREQYALIKENLDAVFQGRVTLDEILT